MHSYRSLYKTSTRLASRLPSSASYHLALPHATRSHLPASSLRQEVRASYPDPAKYSYTSGSILTANLAPSRSESATSRLSLISRHLDHRPLPPINTPYTVDRTSSINDDLPYTPLDRTAKRRLSTTSRKMSSSTQEPHPALLIPGPIEISDEVSQSMSHYAQSHVGQPFVDVFGDTLAMLRKLFQTTNPKSQPFVLAGSGTLGWDLVAANLVEPGEDVLVLHTGYFANSFADCFEIYGAKPTQLKASIGDRPQLADIEAALKQKKYKALTVTHVDTSTGVLSELASLSELVRRVSPDTLFIVDGVCSVGAEELHFDDMSVDVALTASQKAIGCPPGLSILMVSEKAMDVFKSRKSPPGSYYASFKNWLPIMQNYEAKKPSYFATPPTQLIQALHTSLKTITAQPMKQRFAQHKKVSDKVKKSVTELGLKQLASEEENQAHGMTAIYLPEGLTPPEILPTLMKKGVVFAGGLHKEIASKYIRFGHMGVSVTDESRGDIDKALEALKTGLAEVQKAKGQESNGTNGANGAHRANGTNGTNGTKA